MKMKKWLAGILAAVMLVNVVQIPFNVSADDGTEIVKKTLYVSSAGNDETGNGTTTYPYATISKAEESLEAAFQANEADEGIIIINGSVDFTASTHTKMITIKGDGENTTQLNLRQEQIKSILGPTTIESVKVNTGTTYGQGIQTVCEELILGKEITMIGDAHAYFFVGAWQASANGSTTPTLTINSMPQNGTYLNIIQVGTGYNNWMSGAEITINGGTITRITFGHGTQYGDDINITLNGGTIGEIVADDVDKNYSALQIIMNNGIRTTLTNIDHIVNSAGDKWIMYGDTTGGALSTTETAGTFKVTEGVVAKAINNSTGEIYYSGANGYLVVPAGEYNVSADDGTEIVKKTLYVSSAGNDETGNGTTTYPYATISKAEESLEAAFQANEADEGIIIINGSVDFTASTHTKMITIKGDGENTTQLNLRQEQIKSILGPTTIESVKVNTGTTYGNGIQTVCEELILGKEITIIGDAHAYFFVGAWQTSASGSTTPTLTINSMPQNGTYLNLIQVGTGYNNWMSGAEITINDGTITRITFGHRTQYGDDINITLNGGTIGEIVAYDVDKNYSALQIIMNNGIRTTLTNIDHIVNSAGDKWIMYGDTTGGALSTTETAGTFKVEGEFYVKITSTEDETKVYYSVPNSTVTVPAGTYNVTYLPQLPEGFYEIILDGVSQGVYEAGTQYTLPTPEKAEHEFLGWTDGTTNYEGGKMVTVNSNLSLTSTWKTDKAVVYVSSEGNDTTGDGTEEKPYATISRAEEVVDVINANTREVVMLTDMTFTTVAHENMIVIRGNEGNEILSASNSISVLGPTTFKNHMVVATFSPYSDGHEVVYENVTGTTTATGMIYIGPMTSTTAGDKVVINSIGNGQWQSPMFRIGAYNSTLTADGNIDVIVNGGHLYQLMFKSGNIIYNGDVNITVNNGTIYDTIRFEGSNNTSTFNGALQIVMNDGSGDTRVDSQVRKIQAAKGSWFMYDDVNESAYVNTDYTKYIGCRLQTTDTPGTFKVVNGSTLEKVYAIATNLEEPSICYYSNNEALLTVPAGEWVVTYSTERPAYYCTGSQVVFNERVKNFQLSDITSNEYKGKLIVGWMNGETLAENNSTFEAGTVLTAVYIDFEKSSNFAIKDTEIRLGDDKTKAGLRYIIDMNPNLYNEIGGTEYGIIAIEADNVSILNSGDIVIGGNYNGKTPAEIVSQKIFIAYDERLSYTLCLTDISEADYSTEYMIRGYIKFIDRNGIQRVAYTDFEQSSVKSTVEKMLADETVSETIKDTLKTEYMTVINTKRAKLASTYTKGTADKFGAYTLHNGLNVREITIGEEDNDTTDDVTLVQLTDLHLNLVGKKDFEENRQAVLSFYRNREWQKNAATATNTIKALEYADTVADQIVVTGDTIDSLSYGALDASKRLLWSKYPNIISTTGNHEWVEGRGMGKISETLTKEEIENVLQAYSKHGVLYSSKVLKDKVMIIQMDNAYWNNDSYSYIQSQYDSLAADLQTAKTEDYIVLIFQHVALKCDGENQIYDASHEGTVKLAPSTASVNMAQGDNYVKLSALDESAVNNQVYNLIVQNKDIIKGIFCGHVHSSLDTTVGGIPQYILMSNQYDSGYVLKINVK